MRVAKNVCRCHPSSVWRQKGNRFPNTPVACGLFSGRNVTKIHSPHMIINECQSKIKSKKKSKSVLILGSSTQGHECSWVYKALVKRI